MADILCMLTTLYLLILIGRFLMSFIPIAPDSPVAPVRSVLFSLTEPVLAPLRRSVPPVRWCCGTRPFAVDRAARFVRHKGAARLLSSR